MAMSRIVRPHDTHVECDVVEHRPLSPKQEPGLLTEPRHFRGDVIGLVVASDVEDANAKPHRFRCGPLLRSVARAWLIFGIRVSTFHTSHRGKLHTEGLRVSESEKSSERIPA